jgi:murein DD-endopeptidase MepM/ murein hydrolase activator NlpD
MSTTTWSRIDPRSQIVTGQDGSDVLPDVVPPTSPMTVGDDLGLARPSLDRRQLLRACGLTMAVAAVGAATLRGASPAAAWSFDPGSYTTPVAYQCYPVTQWYGSGSHTSGENACAIDIGCPSRTPIYAPKDGVVAYEGWEGVGGIVCRINHNDGLQTILAHLSETVINNGSAVSGGYTLIGYSGATGNVSGPHLHWALVVQGTSTAIAMDGIPGVSPTQICP